MQFSVSMIAIFLAFSLHFQYPLIIPFVNCDVSVNCGSIVNIASLDGREWVGESIAAFISGKSRSASTSSSFHSIDPVPYRTSRISASEFGYTFNLSPGEKFIRLHFYPASYHGFETSVDYFSVKAGPFTLLRDFSASVTAGTLGVEYIVKEFCLNVKENQELEVAFSPSHNSKSNNNKVHAFVNGIEIISMPTGLYYPPEIARGARVVGPNKGLYIIDNSTALEVMQRFNVGGSSITSSEDFGMFRHWTQDTDYLLEPMGAIRSNHLALTNKAAFAAPPDIFQTSWKSGNKASNNQMFLFRWKVPVDTGFGYLVRLHFCDHYSSVADSDQNKEFSLLINNHIAEPKADVIRWSGGTGNPVYRDYVILLKGDTGSSKSDLLIGLEAADELVFQLLNGIEILKLSDLRNNLAAPNPVFPKGMSASRSLKTKILSLASAQSNFIGIAMAVIPLLVLLGVGMFKMRNFHGVKFSEAAPTEPSFCRFSLTDINLATQNFSHECMIGRGGFGNVYKGVIPGVSQSVAIKRLKPDSKQGAREFSTEIETLSKVRHFNLVPLLGYCDEDEEMILVYEYMPRGTLADNLYNKFCRNGEDCTCLNWEQRLSICAGAARGLEYLHTGGEYGVIHRDLKDTNILLDENLVAKIADFGLSTLEKITHSKSYVSTNVKGTPGYWDPDYVRMRKLTRKSDVYSFGVVMLVVLSGRRAVDDGSPGLIPQCSLVSCLKDCLEKGDFSSLVDPCLLREISPKGNDRIRQFVKIVEKCVLLGSKERPTMTQVVAELEQALGEQGCPMGFGQSCEEGNIHQWSQLQLEAPIVEEGITSIASPTRGRKNLQSQKSPPVRKPIWGRPWKLFRNKERTNNIGGNIGGGISPESDAVWEKLLPSDYQEIISECVGPPLEYATKKELFHKLCHSPIIINDGELSFWLSKSSGKKCYMMCARELSIEWKQDPKNWSWKSIPESRFSEVAELVEVWWLQIEGRMKSRMLSPNTTYSAYLVYKVTEASYGLEKAAEASVRFGRKGNGPISTSRSVHLIGGKVSQPRMDGWREICLGEFSSDEVEGDIVIELHQTNDSLRKRGLILEGIELRPKEDSG